jgi:hypothetical protein
MAPAKTSKPLFLKSKYLVPEIKIASPRGIHGNSSIYTGKVDDSEPATAGG